MRTDSDPSQALAGPTLTRRERQVRCLSASGLQRMVYMATRLLLNDVGPLISVASVQQISENVGWAPNRDAGQIAIARDFLLAA